MRANVTCPACGVAIQFGFWPRAAHFVVGLAVLVAGLVTALKLGQPTPLVLAASAWFGFALLLPVAAESHDPQRSGDTGAD